MMEFLQKANAEYLLIAVFPMFLFAFVSRAAGSGDKGFGTLWTGWPGAPEFVYGVMFATVSFCLYRDLWLAIAGGVISWRAMELGHGTFYYMKGWQGDEGPPHYGTPENPRMTTIDHIMMPFFRTIKMDPKSPAYSWAAMFAKGTLIAFPLGWFAPLNGLLFAEAYQWNRFNRTMPDHQDEAEWAAGAAAGVVVIVATILVAP